MTQFLPPISATTRLSWRAPGATSAAVRRSSRPTGPEPVKAIVATSRVSRERGAGVALAGQQRDRAGRHAAGAQRLDDAQAAAGRLLGRLQHDGVARRERRGGHAHRDREREVPRRDDRADAARRVAQLVALAGHLQQRRAGGQLDRAARVELEEVDRLADVRVGLRPGLRALAHRERGEARGGARASRRRRAAARRRGRARASPPTARTRPSRRPRRRRPPRASRGRRARRRARGRRGPSRRAPRRRGDRGRSRPARAAAARARRAPSRASRARSRGAARGRARWRRARGSCRRALRRPRRGTARGRRRAHAGGARSCSSGTPWAWSARKLSLAVFSSRRRTR